MAAEVIKVVDPDSGIGFDYTSLSLWEAGECKDLTVTSEQATAKCRCTGGSADTSVCIFSASWVSSATCYVKIWTDPAESYRHNGTWSSSKYRLERVADHGHIIQRAYNSGPNHLYIIGIQFRPFWDNTWGSADAINIYTQGNGFNYVEKCIIRGDNILTRPGAGISFAPVQGAVYASNCLVYDFDTSDSRGIKLANGNSASYVQYCTVHNCTTGIEDVGPFGNVRAKNCLVQDCGTCYVGTFAGSSHNCSDDNTQPGTSGQNGEVLFENEAGDNFHLGSGDTVAMSNGTPLHNDFSYPTVDDVDGDTRDTSTPDIGFDEFVGGVIHEGSATAKGVGLLGTIAGNTIVTGLTTALAKGLLGTVAAGLILTSPATATGTGLIGTVAAGVERPGSATVLGIGAVGVAAPDLTLGGSSTATGSGLPGTIAPSVELSGMATVLGRGLLGDIIGTIFGEVLGTATAKGAGLLGTIEPAMVLSGDAIVFGRGLLGTINPALTLGGNATALGRGLLGDIIGTLFGEILGSATVLGIGDLGGISAVLDLSGSAETKGVGLLGPIVPRLELGGEAAALGMGLLGPIVPRLELGGEAIVLGVGLLGAVEPKLELGGNATIVGAGLLGTIAPNLELGGEATALGSGLLGDIIGYVTVAGQVFGSGTVLGSGLLGDIIGTVISVGDVLGSATVLGVGLVRIGKGDPKSIDTGLLSVALVNSASILVGIVDETELLVDIVEEGNPL